MAINFRGYLFDDSGNAIQGATVQLLEQDGTQEASTTTDSNGLWSFSESHEDNYDIKITQGSSIRWIQWDDQVSLKEIDVRNNTGNTTPAATFTNTTNNPSNQVANFRSTNTTRADDDEIYLSFTLADSAGNLDEFARITVVATDTDSTNEDGAIEFDVMKDGALTKVWEIKSYGADGDTPSMSFDMNMDSLTIGSGADTDITLTFDANSADGVITWMEDEDYFKFSDDILMNSTEKIQFYDTGLYIYSSTDGQLDIVADTEVQIAASTVDLDGNLDVSGTYTGGGLMTTGGSIVIPNAGNIGSASDTDAIAISSAGVVTMNQIPVFSAGINVSGGTIAGTLATAAQANVTSLGTLTALTVDDVAVDGKVITMTGSSSDTAVFTAGTNGTLTIETTDAAAAAANIQITADGTAELAGTTVTLDSAGGITLDADNGTITFSDAGSSLGTITSSGYSGTAAVATTVTITDNESTNENNALIFTSGGDLDGGNIGLESDGDLYYNPSTSTLTVPNISVSGTFSTVNSVTMDANNAVIFEGSSADAHETTLTSVNATADRTISLPNVSGTLPVLETASTTQISSTPEELNILDGATITVSELNLIDGDTARGTTAVASGDGILINDGGTMRMTNVDTVSTYFASHNVGGGNIVTTGALDSGSITTNFGNIDNGSSTITTTGLISGGSLDIDNVLINGTTIGHTDDTDLMTVADGLLTIAGEISVTTLDIGGTNVGSTAAELNFLDGSAKSTSSITIADSDAFIIIDGTTTKQIPASDIKTYASSATAADDIGTGDGAVNLVTTSGNITIDAQANDADVIIKVDDNGSAVTAVTFDGSDEGNAIFVNDIQLKSDSAVLKFGTDLDTTLTHTDGTGLTLNSTNKLTFGDTGTFIHQSSDGVLTIESDTTVDINGAVVLNGAITGATNITLSGELDAATLDISGNADIDGTLETDNLTIGGSQGSDGQVLTSTGSGVAWEDAGGGGTQSMVASSDGDIAAGAPVYVHTDGKVKPITGGWGAMDFMDLDQILTKTNNGNYEVQAMDISGNARVFSYWNHVVGGKPTGCVGTVNSDGTITWGTAVDMGFGEVVTYTSMCQASADGTKAALFYTTGDTVVHSRIITVDHSDNTFDVGAERDSGANTGEQYGAVACAWSPDLEEILVISGDTSGSNRTIRLSEFDPDGNASDEGTFGTVTVDGDIGAGADINNYKAVYDTVQNKFIIVYRSGGNKFYTTAVTLPGGGGKPTVGAIVEIFDGNGYSPSLTWESTNGNAIVAYINCAESDIRLQTIRMPSGSDPTVALGTELDTGLSNSVGDGFGEHLVHHDPDSGVNVLFGRSSIDNGDNQLRAYTFTCTGTNSVNPQALSSVVALPTGQYTDAIYIRASYSTIADRLILTWYDNDNEYMAYITANNTYAGDLVESSNGFFGFNTAAVDVSSSTAATITVSGGLNENQTGLTVGTRYYMTAGGTLTPSKYAKGVAGSVYAGVATASTKLLVAGSYVE